MRLAIPAAPGADELQHRDEEAVGRLVGEGKAALAAPGQRHQADHPARPGGAAVHYRVVSDHQGEGQRREADAELVLQVAGNADDAHTPTGQRRRQVSGSVCSTARGTSLRQAQLS